MNKPILRSNLFILAPVERFKEFEDSISSINLEPILFYREPDSTTSYRDKVTEEDVFVQIHNWGKDFSMINDSDKISEEDVRIKIHNYFYFLRQFRFLFNGHKKSSESISNKWITLICGVFLLAGIWSSIYAMFVLTVFFMSCAYFIFYLITLNNKDYLKYWNINPNYK